MWGRNIKEVSSAAVFIIWASSQLQTDRQADRQSFSWIILSTNPTLTPTVTRQRFSFPVSPVYKPLFDPLRGLTETKSTLTKLLQILILITSFMQNERDAPRM